MKLLVISHPCVTAINQQFYAEVEQQTNWQLTIVTPANWKNEYGQQRSVERWSGYQGQLLSIPVWKSGHIPLHCYRSHFLSLLRKVQPDVIYVHHEPYAVATAQVYWANQLTRHCPIGFYSAQNILKSYPPPFRQLEQWVFRHSDFAFPVSYSVEQVLKQKQYAGQIIRLPLGIDPSVYYPDPQASPIAERFRATQDDVLLGYVGRITEEKGLHTLLQALAHIRDLPWQLLMIGSGSYERTMQSLIRQLHLSDRVHCLGYVPHREAPRYLSALDGLILPSETRPHWKEQFGRVIIEALACGTPVIGSNSGEIPYLIHDLQGGLIFQEGQPTSLADQLQLFILNPDLRANLATKGKDRVLQAYTNASLAQRFAETIAACV